MDIFNLGGLPVTGTHEIAIVPGHRKRGPEDEILGRSTDTDCEFVPVAIVTGFGEAAAEHVLHSPLRDTETEQKEDEDVYGNNLPSSLHHEEFVSFMEMVSRVTNFYGTKLGHDTSSVHPCHRGILELAQRMTCHGIPLGCRTPKVVSVPALDTREVLKVSKEATRDLKAWSWVHTPCEHLECFLQTQHKEFTLTNLEAVSIIDMATLVREPIAVVHTNETPHESPFDATKRLSIMNLVPSLALRIPRCHHLEVETSVLGVAFDDAGWRLGMKHDVVGVAK